MLNFELEHTIWSITTIIKRKWILYGYRYVYVYGVINEDCINHILRKMRNFSNLIIYSGQLNIIIKYLKVIMPLRFFVVANAFEILNHLLLIKFQFQL